MGFQTQFYWSIFFGAPRLAYVTHTASIQAGVVQLTIPNLSRKNPKLNLLACSPSLSFFLEHSFNHRSVSPTLGMTSNRQTNLLPRLLPREEPLGWRLPLPHDTVDTIDKPRRRAVIAACDSCRRLKAKVQLA